MAFRWDFADNVGPLLAEAMDRRQRAQQLEAEAARWNLQFNAQKEQWGKSYDAARSDADRNFSLNRANSMRETINQYRDDYVTADAIKALGLDPKRFTGIQSDKLNEQISSIYGETSPLLPSGVTMYERGTVGAAHQALVQQRLIDQATPKTIPGINEIPAIKQTAQSTKRIIGAGFAEDIPANRVAKIQISRDPATAKDYLLKKVPGLELAPNDEVTYNAESDAFEIRQVDPQTGLEVFLPNESYDKAEVDAFMKTKLPAMTAALQKMSPMERDRSNQQIEYTASRLAHIAQQYPQYANLIAPFMPELVNKMQKDAVVQEKMASQSAARERTTQIQQLRLILQNAEKGSEEHSTALDALMRLQLQ